MSIKRRLVWLKANLSWVLNPFIYTYYFEGKEQPETTAEDASIDMAARKLSKGKLVWAKTELTRRRCKVCGVTFWAHSKNDYCKRRRCYVAYQLMQYDRRQKARSKARRHGAKRHHKLNSGHGRAANNELPAQAGTRRQ